MFLSLAPIVLCFQHIFQPYFYALSIGLWSDML